MTNLMQSLKEPNKFLLVVVAFNILLAGFFLLFIFKMLNESFLFSVSPYPLIKIEMKRTENQKIIEKIFSLQTKPIEFSLPSLEKSFVFYHYYPRPDDFDQKATLIIEHKNSHKTHKISSNARVHIKFSQEGCYDFSDQASKMFITIEAMRSEHFRATIQLNPLDYHEQQPIRKTFSLSFQKPSFDMKKYDKQLAGIDYCGIDLVMKKLNKDCIRAKLNLPFHQTSCLIREKEVFCWKNDKWQKTMDLHSTTDLPLLRIEQLTQEQAQIRLWDENGITFTQTLLLKKDVSNKMKPENIFQSAIYRQKDFVNLKVKNQRIVAKPNSWFVFLHNRWQPVKASLLCRWLKKPDFIGELIFFEEVKKRGIKKCLVGCVFDSSHTQMQRFEIPLLQTGRRLGKNIGRSQQQGLFFSSYNRGTP